MDHSKFITTRPDFSKEIRFDDRPLVIDGTEVRALIMREATVDDRLLLMKRVDATSLAEGEVQMIADLVEQPPEAIRKLAIPQYARLQEAASDFFD